MVRGGYYYYAIKMFRELRHEMAESSKVTELVSGRAEKHPILGRVASSSVLLTSTLAHLLMYVTRVTGIYPYVS